MSRSDRALPTVLGKLLDAFCESKPTAYGDSMVAVKVGVWEALIRYRDIEASLRILKESASEENRKPRPGKPGEWAWIAAGLDAYHAVNLREALKVIPDTGDWHGSLRAACNIVLQEHPDATPNQTSEQMKEAMKRA